MDRVRAQRMASELKGHTLGGWRLEEYLDCGKSALVFRAASAGKQAAVKIFDPEIVERYGDHHQLRRIEREKLLLGKEHPNLIQIYGGGEAVLFDQRLLFVVMEYFPHRNLASNLQKIPVSKIGSVISKVAAAAKFLEQNGLCHRDIKPENICCDESGEQVKLLDLGVLRPIAGSTLTDNQALPFIGTLQYSPPEFLLREEHDSPEGWRAITFYQLGAVLHDLLTRTPIFNEFREPYARLVNAVQHQQPNIEPAGLPIELVTLARNCLVKKPHIRLQLVSWSNFDYALPETDGRMRVKESAEALSLISVQSVEKLEPNRKWTLEKQLIVIAERIRLSVREELLGSSAFPRLVLDECRKVHGGNSAYFLARFEPAQGFSKFLTFVIKLSWVDISEELLSVTVKAIVSDAALAADDSLIVIESSEPPIYRGVFVLEAICSNLSPFFYAGVMVARECSSCLKEPVVFGVELLASIAE